MLVSSLPSSFPEPYSLSTSSLGCNALCIVISFLVLWSNCLSSSLAHFKNGPEYLMKGTAQVFISLIRFLLYNFVSCSFLALLRYSFEIFSFISTYLMSASNILKYLYVSFSLGVLIFSWFSNLIPFVMCRFPQFIISMAHFSKSNSIPMSWLYILTACIRVSNYFSFLANSLISFMYIRWFIFSCDLISLYPAVHFLSMWLSGIIAIINSNGDCASPWNIPLWIFVSTKLFPPAVNSPLQVFMVFSIKFVTSSDIIYISRQFITTLHYILIRRFYHGGILWRYETRGFYSLLVCSLKSEWQQVISGFHDSPKYHSCFCSVGVWMISILPLTFRLVFRGWNVPRASISLLSF